MKRLVLALTTGVLSALLLVAPAAAQTGPYGGNPPPPPPPGPPEGCPVEDPPPDPVPPCNPRVEADVSDSEPSPGDTVTVTTPPVFAPGSAITVNIVRANNTAQSGQLATGTATGAGQVSETVTIPDVPPGVYFVYVTGTGPDGNPVVGLVPIVVRAANAAQVAGDSAVFTASAAPVPAQVAEVQADLSTAAEAAIVEAVTAGDAGLLLSPEGQLNVRTAQGVQQAGSLPTTGSDGIATQVAVGAALLLAGTGLVLMRRKGFVK